MVTAVGGVTTNIYLLFVRIHHCVIEGNLVLHDMIL